MPQKNNSASTNDDGIDGDEIEQAGDDAVRRIQRLWRKYQKACGVATQAILQHHHLHRQQQQQQNISSATTTRNFPKGKTATKKEDGLSKRRGSGIDVGDADDDASSRESAAEATLVQLARAARRIQTFWRRLYTAAGVDEVDDDFEGDDGKPAVAAASHRNEAAAAATSDDPRREKSGDYYHHHHHHHRGGRQPQQQAQQQQRSLPRSCVPTSDAAQSIQRMWRRYRQALLDHQHDEQEEHEKQSLPLRSQRENRTAASDGGDDEIDGGDERLSRISRTVSERTSVNRNVKGNGAKDLSTTASRETYDNDNNNITSTSNNNTSNVAASAAVVEQCLRELQQECESLAGSIDDIASSLFDSQDNGEVGDIDDEGDEKFSRRSSRDDNADDDDDDDLDLDDDDVEDDVEDGRSAVLRIQRWWRRSSRQNGSDINNTSYNGYNIAASSLGASSVANNGVESTNAIQPLPQSDGEHDRQRAESAIRALQFRFRLRRLRQIFEERDRSEAAERVQRAWRVRRTRQQHAQRLRDGMRDGAARVIQNAFRRRSGASESDRISPLQRQSPDEGNQQRQQQQHQQSRSSCFGLQRRHANDCDLLSDVRPIPHCIVCLGEDVQVCFLPCGHAQTCLLCGNVLRRCPTCRAIVAMRIRIYL